MAETETCQNEEFLGLFSKDYQANYNPDLQRDKSSKGFIGTIMFLLLFSLFLVFYILSREDEALKYIKDHHLYSLIQTSATEQCVQDIIKPVIDFKTYRYLDLPNGMKVMIISDPYTLLGSASVSVQAGSFEDPPEMQGLAHFCEHMVFLESEQYPDLNGFQKYVSALGGNTNAFTRSEDTTFYFEVTAGGLESTLSRFVTFFIDPIFTQELMKEEVVAVDGELHRNLNNGSWRLRFLLEILSNPNSPLSKFSTGSADSLVNFPLKNGIDIVQALKNFFDRYYSANLMSAVVVHNKPIDELEQIARKILSKIPNKNRVKPSYAQTPWPFSGEFAMKLVQYIPSDPVCSAQFVFSVGSSMKQPFLDPFNYLTQILMDHGEGSLLTILMEKGLANSMVAGSSLITSEFETYLIDINLSEEGLNNIEEVAKILFAYLDLVMKNDISENYYNQFAKINNYTFNYVPNTASTMDKLSSIVSNLWIFPPKYAVSGSRTANKFDKQLLTQYISQLNPQNLMLFIRNPNFKVAPNPTETSKQRSFMEVFSHLQKDGVRKTGTLKAASKKASAQENTNIKFKDLDLKDSLYGISYAKSDLSQDFINNLKNVKYQDYPELKLPDVNEFVSDSFKLVNKTCMVGQMKCKQDYAADADVKSPTAIMETDHIRVWHQLDRSSQTPLIVGDIVFYSKSISEDVITQALAALRVELIKVLLEEELYQSTLAGNSIDFKTLTIQLEAFPDVFPDMLTTILQKYKEFDFTEAQFNEALGNLVSTLYYGVMSTPYANLAKYKAKLLLEHYFMETELFEVIAKLDYNLAVQMARDLYSPLYCEALFIGNVLDSQAKELGSKIVQTLKYDAPDDNDTLKNRVLNITGQNLVLRGFEPTGSTTQNLILNSYQDGVVSIAKLAYIQLLMKVMEMEVYTYIRTEKQIGYLVQAYPERLKNVLSVNILVESNTLDPHQIDEQIEISLQRTEEKLKSLTDEEFAGMVNSLAETLSQESQTLNEKADTYFSHIVNQDYIFDMRPRTLKYLEKVTKDNLLKYFTHLVKTPRKLSIQLYANSITELPTVTLAKEKQFSGTEAKLIDDVSVLEGLNRFPIDLDLDAE